jgi:hypothetical protein
MKAYLHCGLLAVADIENDRVPFGSNRSPVVFCFELPCYLELPLPIEFKRPPSTGKIAFVM